MKTTKSLKTVAFALGLAAMGLTAGNLNAQTGGGLFRKGAETEAGASNGSFMRATGGTGTGFNIGVEQFGGENGGGEGGFNIGTEQFGDAPLLRLARPTHFQKNVKNRKTTKNTSIYNEKT